MIIKFAISNVCSAFNSHTVGSKVTHLGLFIQALAEALATYDDTNDKTPGQHFVMLPESATALVSAGVALRETIPSTPGHAVLGYVVREHRGRVDVFARREYAARATGVAAVVYTLAAYLADPDVTEEEAREIPEGTSHVIVAVLAFAGPKAPLSPYRLVANLAGGNNDALTYTADEMRALARDAIAYDNEYVVVAD
jgi:hypothetical protein